MRNVSLLTLCTTIVRLKRDGTRAEIRFRLSPKRTSPFKSAGRQFSRLLAAEVCASALVKLDTPLSEVVWEYWLPTPLASFSFTYPPVRHRVPSGFKRTLQHVLSPLLRIISVLWVWVLWTSSGYTVTWRIRYFNTCTVHLLLFCTKTKCTIISQIVTLLHVSTLSCHLQGACNQYFATLHKYFKCSCR
jgi:hypothetical protein